MARRKIHSPVISAAVTARPTIKFHCQRLCLEPVPVRGNFFRLESSLQNRRENNRYIFSRRNSSGCWPARTGRPRKRCERRECPCRRGDFAGAVVARHAADAQFGCVGRRHFFASTSCHGGISSSNSLFNPQSESSSCSHSNHAVLAGTSAMGNASNKENFPKCRTNYRSIRPLPADCRRGRRGP